MDVSVIIVNWNVKPLLRRCLASLQVQQGVDFEVIVVDNASSDGSAMMVAEEFPEYTLIASNRNLGFAAANNIGIERANGDFVLLLNPDTELTDTLTLEKLVRFMEERPHVGIVGPRLLNADRTLQRSIRRFPTFLSQALIMLKLHHLLPRLRSLKEYFATDIDHATERSVDQVMGACFMIRGEVIHAIGNLDERFFIWFEEVDYCRRAIDSGFQVCYAPHIEVVHHGGESFGKEFGPKKQHYFNTSLRKYFWKHHSRISASILTALAPISQVLASVVATVRGKEDVGGTFRATFRSALLFIVLFEILSFLGFLYPVFSSLVFAVLIVLAAVLAITDFEVAALLLLAELFIGSQGGYLVSTGAASGANVSLRLGLFLIVFTVWVARNACRERPDQG
ncbi:glycosyltransferase family 2 protein [Patescibacteria group bacterium]